jgi:hypothetical protein
MESILCHFSHFSAYYKPPVCFLIWASWLLRCKKRELNLISFRQWPSSVPEWHVTKRCLPLPFIGPVPSSVFLITGWKTGLLLSSLRALFNWHSLSCVRVIWEYENSISVVDVESVKIQAKVADSVSRFGCSSYSLWSFLNVTLCGNRNRLNGSIQKWGSFDIYHYPHFCE